MPNKSLRCSNLFPGQQLYKYSLKRCIGKGNFGQVWLADDQSVSCEYAIKILKPEVEVPDFLQEARIGHQLAHRNVVRVHYADFVSGNTGGYGIIVMDYMSKGSVTRFANPASFLKLPLVIKLGRDILSGLRHLHSSDFVHCDIKPGNVLVGPEGQGMISDYGIARQFQNCTVFRPTFTYVFHTAPEVLRSNPFTARTDIFQVGLTLFRMLVGLDWLRQKYNRLGKQGYDQALLDGNLISKTDFPAYVPDRLRRIILKAVAPDCAERFPSALKMQRELEKLNYPGHWTVTDNGDFVGHNGNYIYRFRKKQISRSRYDVVARKCHITSKRDTRCVKFCHSNLTNSVADRKIDKFIKAVVEGI